MKRPKPPKQYTIRRVPHVVDVALRQKAKTEGRSLNEVAVEALSQAANLSDNGHAFDDLDSLIGTWVDDPAFDEALRQQDSVDEKLWR